jgi:hypothetical protein
VEGCDEIRDKRLIELKLKLKVGFPSIVCNGGVAGAA